MTNLQPGQQLGPYQIISQIGKGGMATVYKAYHAAVDRYVAIKIISTQLVENAEFLKRFQQEARLIAKLEHPHILPIHDFGESEGVPYMVMRYLEAGTLKERLKSNALTLAETDRIFTQLTDALEYAHENGVIHRDIKPSNVMLDKRGAVFLTDFGVAKILEGSSGLTATGTITGTPDYMSPEQAQGLKVDRRSDVYSLGIVLFEMLTGHVPFEAETPLAVLFKQIQEPPPPLSVIRPDLPFQIEPVLLKALTKNPADRFASIRDFHEAWARAIASIASMQEVPTTPPSAGLPKPVDILPAEPPAALPAKATVQAPAPTIEAPVPSAPPVEKPAKKGFPWLAVGIGAFVVCLVFVTAFVAGRLITRRNIGIATQSTRTAIAETKSTLPPDQTQSPPPTAPAKVAAGNEKVTSWAGGNSIRTILPLRDTIYTGGPGGITEWNPATGAATQWTMRDGLPASNVSALFQDSNGGIWIGTTAGLVHLTNTARELYTTSDGLDSEDVSGLSWRKNQLWISTQYCVGEGCGLQTMTEGKIEPVKGFPSQDDPDTAHVYHNTNFVYVDKQEQVWVGTENGLAFLDRRGRWKVFNKSNGLTGDQVFSILEDTAGSIWVGTNEGGVLKFDNGNATFVQQFDLRERGIYDVIGMLQSGDGHYWFTGGGLVEYDPNTKELTVYSPDENNFPAYNSSTLAHGPLGVMYIGTTGEGLIRFENGAAIQWSIPNVPGEAGYSEIVSANDGSLYFIEEFWNEVDQFIPSTGKWKNGLAEELSIPRVIGHDGQVWGGSWNGVWIISLDGDRENLTTANGLPSDQVNSIAIDKAGNAWVATEGGLVMLKGNQITSVITGKEIGLESDVVRKLFVDSKDNLWVAGENGEVIGQRLPDGSWSTFTPTALFGADTSASPITDFAELPNGDTLITTYGNGIYRRTPDNQWSQIESGSEGVTLPIDYIHCLAVAPDGSLWLGLDDRAVRFDGKTWKGFTIKDGLSGPIVYDIYIGPDGSVWFATNGGVTRFEP